MSIQNDYQPSTRLCDDPQRLRELYCRQDMTIETIAEEHATVGRTWLSKKMREYGITTEGSSDSTRSGNRGSDPPESVDWSTVA